MWYSVRLHFREGANDTLRCEDTIHLVYAESEDEAREKALALGAVERQYFGSPPEASKCEFLGISTVREIGEDDPTDGTEVWSFLNT